MIDYVRGSIYYANLPIDNGCVQGGCRPVVIVSNNINNKFNSVVTVVPLTSKVKRDMPTHVKIKHHKLKEESTALCEQILTVDKNSLGTKLGEIKTLDLLTIQNAMFVQLGDVAI